MKLIIRKPTSSILSARIPSPRALGKVPVRACIINLAMIVLCLGTLNVKGILFNFPIVFLMLILDVLGILCIRHMGDLDYGMDLLPFTVTMVITLVFQCLLAGPYFVWTDSFSAIILVLGMVLLVILIMQKGYAHSIWRIINFFNLVSSICILVQCVAYWAGLRLDKMGMLSEWFFNAWEFTASFRPCGPHDEPSVFAQAVLPSLYYYLFVGKNGKKALLCIAGLCVSTSALGLLGMLLLLVVWLFSLDKLYGIGIRFKFLVLSVLMLLGATVFLAAVNMDVFIVQRMMSGSSVGIRLLRSVDLYALMSPVEKIIGIGVQNQQRYLNFHGIVLAHDTYETTIGANREFAGTLGYILCTTGFFGLVFFVMPFYRAFTRYGLQVKVACALLLFCAAFCTFFGQTILPMYLLMVYATIDLDRSGAFLQENENDA